MTPSKVQVKRLLRKLSRSWRRPLDGPAAESLARARQYLWSHSRRLGEWGRNPGSKSLDVLHAEAEAVFGPLDLRGKSVLDIETHLGLRGLERPAMVFYPGAELNNDPTNWGGPNRQCMEALLKLVGFGRIVYQPHPIDKGARGIFHAYKKP